MFILSKYYPYQFNSEIWAMTNFFFNFYFFLESTLKYIIVIKGAHTINRHLIRLYVSKDYSVYMKSSEFVIDVISIYPYFVLRFIFDANPFTVQPQSQLYNLADLFCMTRIARLQKCSNYIVSYIQASSRLSIWQLGIRD